MSKFKIIIDMQRGSKFTYEYNTPHEVMELIEKKLQHWYDSNMTEMTTLVLENGREVETFVKVKKYLSKLINESDKKTKKVLFSKLALGSRFKYDDDDTNVWVKIDSRGTIAKWQDEFATASWIGQPICCLNDTGDDQKVIFLG